MPPPDCAIKEYLRQKEVSSTSGKTNGAGGHFGISFVDFADRTCIFSAIPVWQGTPAKQSAHAYGVLAESGQRGQTVPHATVTDGCAGLRARPWTGTCRKSAGFAQYRRDSRQLVVVGYSSGQRGQTVNLLANAFPGSNPGPTTSLRSQRSEERRLSRRSPCIQGEGGHTKQGPLRGSGLAGQPSLLPSRFARSELPPSLSEPGADRSRIGLGFGNVCRFKCGRHAVTGVPRPGLPACCARWSSA